MWAFKVFENGPSKNCGRQPLKKCKGHLKLMLMFSDLCSLLYILYFQKKLEVANTVLMFNVILKFHPEKIFDRELLRSSNSQIKVGCSL